LSISLLLNCVAQYSYSHNDPYLTLSGSSTTASLQYHTVYFGPLWVNNSANYKFKGQLAIPNGLIDGCSVYPNTTQNGQSWSGKIVMIVRINCLAGTKVKLAENAGAIGVLIINCNPGPPSFCADGRNNLWAIWTAYVGQFSSINIPAAVVKYDEGWPIFEQLQKNPSLVINATLTGTGPLIDPSGSIKNALVEMSKVITTPTASQMVGNKATQDWAKNPTDPCTDILRPYAFLCMEGRLIGFDNGGRDLPGTIPAAVNSLTTLNRLVFYQSSVSGIVPNMNNCTSLTDFILYQTPIVSMFETIGQFPDLVVFDVTSAKLSKIPNDFNLLKNLQIFLVANNFIKQLPDISAPALVMYDVSFNQISGPLNNFSGMTELVRINIANNAFYSSNCQTLFENIPKLKQINLASNQLSGPLPTFTNCIRLNVINLSNNQFTGNIPMTWNMPKRCSNNASILCSSACECGSSSAVCQSLTSVSLSRNNITGPFVLTATSITDLDLSFNLIDPTSATWGSYKVGAWANFFNYIPQTVINLDLSNNKIGGTWTSAFFSSSLNNLQKLILSNNKITNLPPDLWGQDALTTVFRIFDASYNNLSGTVPAFKPKVNVEQVYLHGNPYLISSPIGALPTWVSPSAPYVKYGSESYVCPTLIGNMVPFTLRVDPAFYNYQSCICDRGFYGSPPNCLNIPSVVTINGTDKDRSTLTFTDNSYGSNRLTLGVDISWFLNYQSPPGDIVKGYYIQLTRLDIFKQYFTNILEIYSGDWSLQGKRVMSLRGNDSDIVSNIISPSMSGNVAVVLFPNATVVFRSRQSSGFHFYANYTVSFECPQGYQFHPDTASCQQLFKINQSIQVTIFAIISVFVLLLVFITSVIIKKRNSLIIRSSSFPFCLSMLLFMITLGIGSYFYAVYPDQGNYVCYIRPWLTAGPLVGILSALLVKVDRIRRIFTSKDLVVQTITNVQLAQTMGIMMSAEFSLLIGFTASNMSQSVQKLGYGYTNGMLVSICTSSDSSLGSDAFNAWLIIQFIYIATFLLVAVGIAWSVRKVPSAFNEAPSIASSLLSLAVLLIILIPLNYMVDDNPNALMLIRGLGQILVTSVLALFFFGPKLYLILEGKDNDKALSSLGSSKSSSTSSSNQESTINNSQNDQQIILLLKSIFKTMESFVKGGSTDISDLNSCKSGFSKTFKSSSCSQMVEIVKNIEDLIASNNTN